MYIKVTHSKYAMRTYPVYFLFVHFNIESDIKSSDDLLNKPIYGRFSSELLFEGNVKQLDGDLGDYIGNEDFMKSSIELTKTELMIDIAQEFIDKCEAKFAKEHEKDFNFKIPENRISLKDYNVD